MSKEVRTRFAPSPTGYMHVGGVRTALFAWLVARHANGKFILRLEDTDKAREVEGSGEHIVKSLRWLGLDWDEGIDKGGPAGSYMQSERLDTYKEWADKLIAKGRAYADPYSVQQVEEFRQSAKQQKKPFLFRDYRPENPPAWDGSQPLRFKSEPKDYKWHDEVLGGLSTGPEAIDDFILIKPDGYPTYNFAHIIDDYLMECTHVIRSQEFIASVPKFLNLYEALEIERPILATVPMVLGPDGNKKLSKRDGAKDILDYAKEGYLPEALLNFMASLGWNDGTEQEIFSVQELINKFSLERVQRSGARFDEKRLLWMNGQHIRQLSPDKLGELAKPFWEPAGDGNYQKQVLELVQERLKYFAELPELTHYFFEEPSTEKVADLLANPPDKQLQKIDKHAYPEILRAVLEELKESGFGRDDIAERMNRLLQKLDTKPGILFALIRIAVTGSASSPEIFSTLEVLGKGKSLARLQRALESLEK